MRSTRTVFSSDPPALSARTFLYHGSRYLIGGASLIRWLIIVLVVCGIVWAPGWLPGSWFVSIACGLAIVALLFPLWRWRKRDFVTFEARALPSLPAAPLTPEDKIPLHATGYFNVEGKWQRFTWISGFYRVFATRERALLCLIQDKRFLYLGRLPADAVGMWYVFFMPQDVQRVAWGQLAFGREPRPALAIDYSVTVPARNRLRSDPTVVETLYIACQNEADAHTILADLLHDLPKDAVANLTFSA